MSRQSVRRRLRPQITGNLAVIMIRALSDILLIAALLGVVLAGVWQGRAQRLDCPRTLPSPAVCEGR